MTLWVWGKGIHGDVNMHELDPTSSSVLLPVKVQPLNAHMMRCLIAQ